MRVGEIWQDKDDGERVKIKNITYMNIRDGEYSFKDYLVSYEDMEGTSGANLLSKNFLYQFEKCYGE